MTSTGIVTSIQHSFFSPHSTHQHRTIISQDAKYLRVKLQYKEYLDTLTDVHKCVTCKQDFIPSENFVGYFCNIHKEKTVGKNGRWGCCGSTSASLGCIPCIHFRQQEHKDDVYNNFGKIQNVPIILVEHGLIKINRSIFTQLFEDDQAMRDCYQMYCLKQE